MSTHLDREPAPPLLALEHVSVALAAGRTLRSSRRAVVHALDDVTLAVGRGETLGVVGESGCGKTTLIRCAARLTDATAGRILFEGREVTRASRRALRPMRRGVQVVFQDPDASLNPRRRIGRILATPLRLRGVPQAQLRAETAALLAEVGLAAEHAERFPHELSGGQRQRVGIARALAMRPRLLLLDEPVSALDVSVQAQIVNLLDDLRERRGLSCLFVAHDLAIVRHVSDRIAVMYLGKIVETGPAEKLSREPIHPYTDALLAAVPTPDPSVAAPAARTEGGSRLVSGGWGRSAAGRGERAAGAQDTSASGEPAATGQATAASLPHGCRFHPRCPHGTEICRMVEPPLVEYPGGRASACHHPLRVREPEIAAAAISPASPLAAGRELPSMTGETRPRSGTRS